jgi:hypothetical protein
MKQNEVEVEVVEEEGEGTEQRKWETHRQSEDMNGRWMTEELPPLILLVEKEMELEEGEEEEEEVAMRRRRMV